MSSQAGTVNDQILDSVVQAQLATLAQGAAQSMGMVNAVLAETLGMSMHNAVSAQRHSQLTNAASVTATCARLLNSFSPPTPPAPPAPAPSPNGNDNNGSSGIIAKDSQAAQSAIAKLVTDGSKASSATKTAMSGLETLAKQIQQGESTISGTNPTPTPNPTPSPNPDPDPTPNPNPPAPNPPQPPHTT